MNNYNELLWVRKIQHGDQQAFEQLFKFYYLRLTRFAWRYLKSKAIAEELVQEIFTNIWESHESWVIKGDLRSYLYRTVNNRALNYLKHKTIETEYDTQWMEKEKSSIWEFEEQESNEYIKKIIEQAIEELPIRSKMTYKLHWYDGLTYVEIAKVMDVSVKTVESQMTRTLKILRERLSCIKHFLY